MRSTCLTLFFVSVVCITAISQQQTGTKTEIPGFKVLLVDGSYYYDKDIPKDKPFVVIYFSPDCDHCIALMDELFPKIHQLDKASVLMVTFKNPQEIIPFEKKYKTFEYPNIKVGTEGLSYVLRNHYKMEKTPFVALYNKKGKLVNVYRDNIKANIVLASVKNL